MPPNRETGYWTPIPAYQLPIGFACSVPWRISPSRQNLLAGDSFLTVQSASNVYRSSQLGCRRQSLGSCWEYFQRDVYPCSSFSSREAWSNANQFPWGSIQHFSCSWLITANQSLTLWGFTTQSMTWLTQLTLDSASATSLRLGMVASQCWAL